MTQGRAMPVEEFVQAFTAQLDRAQDLLALKARTGRPLTFALRDLAVELHVFWEPDQGGRMLMRHAGPNEAGASTLHFTFTTITKSMVEENTLSLTADEDPRQLDEIGASQALDPHARKRLEWAGVRTVGQLRKLSQNADPKSVQAFTGIPMMQLESLLLQAAEPQVTSQEVVAGGLGVPFLRIRGANLAHGIAPPEVLFSGEPVEVLESSPRELLVRPMSHHHEGKFEVLVGQKRATGFYRLPGEPAPRPGAAPEPSPRGEALKRPDGAQWNDGPRNGHGGAP